MFLLSIYIVNYITPPSSDFTLILSNLGSLLKSEMKGFESIEVSSDI